MPKTVSPAVVVAAAWVFPGLGYWLLGEKRRAIIVCACVLSLFLAGILIGGIRVVDAPDGISVDALMDKPWFIGQIMAGPISIISALGAQTVSPDRVSYARSNEIGTLYTALAGMLNLLVIVDAGHPEDAEDEELAGTGAGETKE